MSKFPLTAGNRSGQASYLSSRGNPVKLCHILATVTLMSLTLNSCRYFTSATPVQSDSPDNSTQIAAVRSPTPVWSGTFDQSNWMQQWKVQNQASWGWQNFAIVPDATRRFSKVLRVSYPRGSASPESARNSRSAIGGGQFLASLGIQPADKLRLSYFVRFSENFDFVKGGKLPGLFGGVANSGGKTPDGTDGFSTRYMWRRGGAGEVYAYLPTSKDYGTSLGRGAWNFRPGVWYRLEQEVTLNRPGKKDGRVRVWINGNRVFEQAGIVFRSTPTLKINGVFFSTFFGGSDQSWATPRSVYADFANFSVTTGS
ncbi:polysaccharide lyase [Phormidesmis priestleyi]